MTKGVTVYLYARTRGAATFFWFVFCFLEAFVTADFTSFPSVL